MVIFGDEDNMVERFVEIDVRVFLDGTLTSRRVFQLTGPGTRKNLGFPGNLRVFTEGLIAIASPCRCAIHTPKALRKHSESP
jgi:hypothetical protein